MEDLLNVVNNYVLVINKQGGIEFCNDKLSSKLNIEKEDILKLNIWNLILNVEKYIEDIIRDIEIHKKLEVSLSFSTGNNEITNLEGHAICDSWEENQHVVFILDDKNKQEEEIYNRKDLEVFLEAMPSSAWIKNVDGEFVYANKAYTKRLGVRIEELIGTKGIEYRNSEIRDTINMIENEVIRTKFYKLLEDEFIIKGEKEYLEFYVAPIIDSKGNVIYTVGTIKNITLIKKLGYEIEDAQRNLSQIGSAVSYNDNNHVDDLCKSICREIIKYTRSDNCCIWIYDSKSSYLNKKVCLWADNHTENDIGLNSVEISNELLEFLKTPSNYEGITTVKDATHIIGRDILIKRNIEHVGTYSIMFSGEFLGIISVGYKKNSRVQYTYDNFLRNISYNVAIIVKTSLVSEELTEEFTNLINSEKELEMFLDTGVDLAAIIDNYGYFKKASKKWNKTMGWSEEDIIGKNFADFIHPDDLKKVYDINVRVKEGKSVDRVRSRGLCKSGKYKWISWRSAFIQSKQVYIVTAIDVTKSKLEEERKLELEKAIEAESLKNEFFANISHEFKTPLNIILATAQLLDKNEKENNIKVQSDLDLKRYINSLKQNSYRLLRLINNLIDMTRIDSGYYELSLGNYDIVNIVEDITLSVAQYVEDKGITIIFDTNSEEQIIACDPDKIERIMLNLLSNAIKYTENSGELFVELNITENKVSVSVQDNGIGMPQEKIDTIFERFRQVDSSLTRKCEGSGIGLSLVKSLVDMHGGKVYVESEEGKGSKFTFELKKITIENEKVQDRLQDSAVNRKIEKCHIEFSDIYKL